MILTAIVVIQTLILVLLWLRGRAEYERVIVLSHFSWSLFELVRSHHSFVASGGALSQIPLDNDLDQLVSVAVGERMHFTWVNPLERFSRSGRTLFWDERYGRFGAHAYRMYFEAVDREWQETKRIVAERSREKESG